VAPSGAKDGRASGATSSGHARLGRGAFVATLFLVEGQNSNNANKTFSQRDLWLGDGLQSSDASACAWPVPGDDLARKFVGFCAEVLYQSAQL
jgi:hypothetical protein